MQVIKMVCVSKNFNMNFNKMSKISYKPSDVKRKQWKKKNKSEHLSINLSIPTQQNPVIFLFILLFVEHEKCKLILSYGHVLGSLIISSWENGIRTGKPGIWDELGARTFSLDSAADN